MKSDKLIQVKKLNAPAFSGNIRDYPTLEQWNQILGKILSHCEGASQEMLNMLLRY